MITHLISNDYLTIESIEDILSEGFEIQLSNLAEEQIDTCHRYLIQKIKSSEKPIYGVNTGFGSLCNVTISNDELSLLQKNLIESHACGTGLCIDNEIVRLMLLLKIQSLSYGHSGVSTETVERLICLYNNKAFPQVYERGSLGASGDLAPLAHLCLPLIGRGVVRYDGKDISGADFLASMNLEPLTLGPKEGLALLNGTQFMSAFGVHIILRLRKISKWADIIAALSLEAFDGRTEPFHSLLQRVRPHQGQIDTARNLRLLLHDSPLANAEKKSVQDPYSFRCVPQVHGAFKEVLKNATEDILTEINSVSDNPNIFTDEDLILSGGNFHGQQIALALDFMAIASSQIACMSERRIYQLLSGKRGLPAFLTSNPGLNSGFMILQYTAAGLANEIKHLAHPHSIDSITSCDGQEDFVSMGANAAVKCKKTVDILQRMLGIELMHASQGLHYRLPKKTAPLLQSIIDAFRKEVPVSENDAVWSPYIEKAFQFLSNYSLEQILSE